MEKNLTVFTVLDNFFGTVVIPKRESILKLNGQEIDFLGDQICTFYLNYPPPPKRTSNDFRAYFGSYIADNLDIIEHNEYLLNSLLYCHEVLIPCPLHSWYAEERTSFGHLYTAKIPFGYYLIYPDRSIKKQIFGTKLYLIETLPILYSLRQLIELGTIRLFPYMNTIYSERQKINSYVKEAFKRPEIQAEVITKEFAPSEITIDTNLKGMFQFGPESIFKENVKSYLELALTHYVRDFTVANVHGGSYTAPFRWENFLTKLFVNKEIEGKASHLRNAVIQATYNSSIPILKDLNIQKIMKIHDSDEFSGFRSQLLNFYKELEPFLFLPEFHNRLLEIEEDIVLPEIQKIENLLQNSSFQRTINAFKAGVFKLTETYASAEFVKLVQASDISTPNALIASIPSFILEMLKSFFDKSSNLSGSQKIWASLIKDHSSQAYTETVEKPINANIGWNPAKQGSIVISAGTALHLFPSPDSIRHEYKDIDWSKVERNARCPCKSGRKYKQCCGSI